MSALPQPPLNAIPEGLLSLLGIKNGGQNPQFLTANLVPTVPLTDWYLETRATVELAEAEVFDGIAEGSVLLTVPQTEWWYVMDVTGLATTNVAGLDNPAYWSLGLSYVASNTAIRIAALPQGVHGAIALDPPSLGISGALCSSRPFWAQPGSRLGLNYKAEVDGTGSIVLSTRARVVRLRA